jgi:hypothetical protein
MTSRPDVLPRATRPASGLAPLVEVVTVEPALAQQLVLAIGTPAQAERLTVATARTAAKRYRIIRVM